MESLETSRVEEWAESQQGNGTAGGRNSRPRPSMLHQQMGSMPSHREDEELLLLLLCMFHDLLSVKSSPVTSSLSEQEHNAVPPFPRL
ncbi:hypothetical protein EYF80_019598 [Liparis tanakae]|uniref:Uncharacterized protein n=1 Tax=Liparis tanakae TaxID=230148 RepID=A0A4Z2HX07_9TELE|nr:hypothetical protein EYF80_019598 [Liparis tanakae]